MPCDNQNENVFCNAEVCECTELAKHIFKLVVKVLKTVNEPKSGQFFMLRAHPSKVLLCRPISVYSVKKVANCLEVEFLILLKGTGTEELCKLKSGDSLEIIGPQGNCFELPKSDEKIAIVGGGIGIAPVAGFASILSEKSYDFFACFKTGSYGLEYVKPNNLYITTDDGSKGTKGMLPNVLTADVIKQNGYDVIYACGPEPMLKYVQKVCAEANVKCWLSMESKMACGMGACLGCTIKTTEGNKRCCVDGPVFEGSKIIFPEAKISISSKKAVDEPDLSTEIAGVRFENPVIAASGTFGYGTEYDSIFDVNKLGGICSKGLTLEGRPGNTGIRLWETASGLINSIGLENPGIDAFIKKQLPKMLSLKPVTIANLSGSSIETYVKGAELLDKTAVPMIELNISCPNVKAGGMAFGLQPEAASEVTQAVRKATTKPLIVKLSPNAPDLVAVAQAVREAGADALSLVNTFQAMAIDVEKGRLVFDNVKAGLAGPAIKPIALRMVYDVCQSMKNLKPEEQIPVIGLGGIYTWQDAVEFIMAGASAIQVGTSTFANPNVMVDIIDGLKAFMKRKNYACIHDFKGLV